jgi:hypothetical protein
VDAVKLTVEQSRRSLEEHGSYLTEACDKCGKLLAEIRFTVKGQSGEWCSRECRDGVAHEWGKCLGCGASLNGKRKDAKYCGNTCRMRVKQDRPNQEIIAQTPVQNKALMGAKSGPLACPLTPGIFDG